MTTLRRLQQVIAAGRPAVGELRSSRRAQSGLPTTRHVLVGVSVLALAAALVGIGRHERSHERAAMQRGIDAVRAAIGPSLTRPGPANYVELPGRSCLLWAAGGRGYALELCIDPLGRVVEAVDRRGTTPKFYPLVEEPDAARLRIAPGLFARLIKKVQAAAG